MRLEYRELKSFLSESLILAGPVRSLLFISENQDREIMKLYVFNQYFVHFKSPAGKGGQDYLTKYQ